MRSNPLRPKNQKAIAIIRANHLGENTAPEELAVRDYAKRTELELDEDLIYQLVEPAKPFTESKRENAILRALRDGFRHVIFARRSDLTENLITDGGWEVYVAQNNLVIHLAKENCVIQREGEPSSESENV